VIPLIAWRRRARATAGVPASLLQASARTAPPQTPAVDDRQERGHRYGARPLASAIAAVDEASGSALAARPRRRCCRPSRRLPFTQPMRASRQRTSSAGTGPSWNARTSTTSAGAVDVVRWARRGDVLALVFLNPSIVVIAVICARDVHAVGAAVVAPTTRARTPRRLPASTRWSGWSTSASSRCSCSA
jgi:hypothetical protein